MLTAMQSSARTEDKPKMTTKQRDLLVKFGYTGALDNLTLDQASDLITQMQAQIDAMTAEAKRRAERMDLVELARGRVQLFKEGTGEYAGPCPKCGGTDRFHVTTTWFFCRQCHEERGDAIEYIMWTTGKDYLSACQEIAGGFSMPQLAPTQAPRPPAPKRPDAPRPDWLRDAKKAADEAAHRLFTESDAEPGREYLIDRGIEPHCWLKFHLGYRHDVPLPGTWDDKRRQRTLPGKPAIVMPWFRGGQVWAIRYRLLETHQYIDAQGKSRKEKQVAYPGSHFAGGLYGGHALPEYTTLPKDDTKPIEGLRTLVICEGEINAISIWQATEPWGWDVLSLGSESQKLSQSAINYAGTFGRVLVWMDRAVIAKELMSLLMPLAYGVNSPAGRDGKKIDANDMLQQGILAAFLAMVRLRSCATDHERQKVKWDLWDADQRPPFLDAGTRGVLAGVTA